MKRFFSDGNLSFWLNKVVAALRKRDRIQVRRPMLSMHEMSQITTGWDYKPTHPNRRDRPFDYGGAGGPELAGAPTSNENDVWFNFMNEPPSGSASNAGDPVNVSTYDQSPIKTGVDDGMHS